MSKVNSARLQQAYHPQSTKSEHTKGEIMATNTTTTTTDGRDLILTRIIDAPREKVFQAWTDPAVLKQWFAPRPWTTPVVENDVRPGGATLMVMRNPDGHEVPTRGVYL